MNKASVFTIFVGFQRNTFWCCLLDTLANIDIKFILKVLFDKSTFLINEEIGKNLKESKRETKFGFFESH